MKNFYILTGSITILLIVIMAIIDFFLFEPGITNEYLYIFVFGIIFIFMASYLLITKDTRIAGLLIHFIKKDKNPLFFWLWLFFYYLVGIILIAIGIAELIG